MQQQHKPHLLRGLNARHIRFIALGSAIGTGLFYGSASAIKAAGSGGAAGLSDWRRGGVFCTPPPTRDITPLLFAGSVSCVKETGQLCPPVSRAAGRVYYRLDLHL